MNALSKFDVADAHCYDPNEEAKLRRVITAVGEDQFNDRVRALARKCKSRHVKRMRLSAAARQAKEHERMRTMFDELMQQRLAPMVEGVNDLKLTLGQTMSEVVKLKAQVLELKQEQRSMKSDMLRPMRDDLARMKADLKKVE
mmetsp:Transcript_12874/g.22683  ORF Transcript_12874/g.22683 Transcript_12874/m.22683 type:complete len:143 (-) Transcript_12874:131-559(-)